jgi:signal transduction histidine kinase
VSHVAYQWATQTGAVLSAVAAVAVLTVAGRAWKRQRNPIDLAFAVAMAGCLVFLLASSANTLATTYPSYLLALFATHAGYQIAIVAISYFFLVSTSVTRFKIHAMWMAQGVLGLLLLTWYVWGSLQQNLAYGLWVALNLVCGSALSLYVWLETCRLGPYRCWLVLGGSLLGLGIGFEDLLGENGMRLDHPMAHYFYAAYLLLLWLLITNRVGHPELAGVPGTEHSSASAWENVTGFGPATKLASAAVADERRRIAQDLHDGVGSQLVNLLASLDTHAPQQQEVALALEQCLMDLKIMVDTIDTTDDSVIDALGRLRYRVQHSLDKLGIRMIWKVDVDGPLQALRGERALQVLRITQECLSNIMRHSHASVVEVVCCYVPESESMLLEVRDNGTGIASRGAGQPVGKGLEGMRLRALKLGGHLEIATKAKVGTRMRLLVPLQAPDAVD